MPSTSTVIVLGSPPHVRVILHAVNVYCDSFGITPACAGNTFPTVCQGKTLLGSPPHVRVIREKKKLN